MPEEPQAYLLLREEHAPALWRERARRFLLVPLLPEEASSVLSGKPARPALDPGEHRLAVLIARGLSVSSISRELDQPLRTVQRRVTRLRQRIGASSTAELAATLARMGFADGADEPPPDAGVGVTNEEST